MKIDKRTVFEIHRLKNLGWSHRKISKTLGISRDSVARYALNPERTAAKRSARGGKLDGFRELIAELLDQDPDISATVVCQHLVERGFDGQVTIVRDELRRMRGTRRKRTAYSRFESPPGQQMQVDWGHFGTIDYDGTRRKLYALVVIEAYSRMLFVRFTHSQNQAAFHQSLAEAFVWFGGSPQELVVDNMATAVVERMGSLVRFNENFLDFLRVFRTVPRACTPGAPYEKGKVEAGVKYVRRSFMPLRSFSDLDDVQRQVVHWLKNVANVRVHQTTGQVPAERFAGLRLSELPDPLPDCRHCLTVLVHKDFAVRFDGNTYTVPPWAIARKVTLKADQDTVSVYLRDKRIAVHQRCWERKKRIQTPAHTEQVRKLRKKMWHDRQVAVLASLGPVVVDYLHRLFDTDQPIKKQVARLLWLNDRYGSQALTHAIERALAYNALGAGYIENILQRESRPKTSHQPVKLKDESLNRIRLSQPCLAEYDAHVLKGKDHDD